MNLGLKDLFVGVVHLFVIFLPGAVLLLSVAYALPGGELQGLVSKLQLSPAGKTLLFAGLSYLVGHLVSLVGSNIEDRYQTILHVKEQGSANAELRRVAFNICVDKMGQDLVRWKSVRRWSRILVRKEHDSLRADIDAKDADRRFFRNIRLVLLITLVIAMGEFISPNIEMVAALKTVAVALVLIILIALSHLRYADQDAKFTKLVFESLIALTEKQDLARSIRGREVTHAGGVVFRLADGKPEYLIVKSTNREKDEWVLPKGHIEEGESVVDASLREVREEAKVDAQAITFIDYLTFQKTQTGSRNVEEVCVACYLMKSCEGLSEDMEQSQTAQRKDTEEEERREIKWCSFGRGCELLFDDAAAILKCAHKLIEKVGFADGRWKPCSPT